MLGGGHLSFGEVSDSCLQAGSDRHPGARTVFLQSSYAGLLLFGQGMYMCVCKCTIIVEQNKEPCLTVGRSAFYSRSAVYMLTFSKSRNRRHSVRVREWCHVSESSVNPWLIITHHESFFHTNAHQRLEHFTVQLVTCTRSSEIYVGRLWRD